MAGRARPGEQVVAGGSAIFLHGSIHTAACKEILPVHPKGNQS